MSALTMGRMTASVKKFGWLSYCVRPTRFGAPVPQSAAMPYQCKFEETGCCHEASAAANSCHSLKRLTSRAKHAPAGMLLHLLSFRRGACYALKHNVANDQPCTADHSPQ